MKLLILNKLGLFLRATAMFCASVTMTSADALEDIKATGQINVGIFTDFPPFASASADMSIQGYDVDVAKYIANKLGVEVNLVSITGQNRIPLLNDKRVDILLSVGFSDERAQVIDYAAPYAPYYISVIGPSAMIVEGPDDLAGKTVAVNRGTLEDTSLTEVAAVDTTVLRFDNYSSVIQAFISGQADLMVVGNDVGAKVLSSQTDLMPVQKFQLLSSPSQIALNKYEEPLKIALIDAVAEMLASGALNAASERWLNTSLDPKNLKN